MANSPTATRAAVRLPKVKVGMAKREVSMTPMSWVRVRLTSHQTNSATAMRPTPIATGTGDTGALAGHDQPPISNAEVGAHQPSDVPSMRPNTTEPKPIADRTGPTTSRRWPVSPRVSFT